MRGLALQGGMLWRVDSAVLRYCDFALACSRAGICASNSWQTQENASTSNVIGGRRMAGRVPSQAQWSEAAASRSIDHDRKEASSFSGRTGPAGSVWGRRESLSLRAKAGRGGGVAPGRVGQIGSAADVQG